jgi:hypothetical protein
VDEHVLADDALLFLRFHRNSYKGKGKTSVAATPRGGNYKEPK